MEVQTINHTPVLSIRFCQTGSHYMLGSVPYVLVLVIDTKLLVIYAKLFVLLGRHHIYYIFQPSH